MCLKPMTPKWKRERDRLLRSLEDELIHTERSDLEQNFQVLEALYEEARALGIFPLKDPLEDIEADIRIARAINVQATPDSNRPDPRPRTCPDSMDLRDRAMRTHDAQGSSKVFSLPGLRGTLRSPLDITTVGGTHSCQIRFF